MIHAMYNTRAGAKQMGSTDRAMRPNSHWVHLKEHVWPDHEKWFHDGGVPFAPHLHNPFGHRIKSTLPNGQLVLADMDLDGYTACQEHNSFSWLTDNFEKELTKYVKKTGAIVNIYAGGFGTPKFSEYRQNDPDKWLRYFWMNTRVFTPFCDALFFDALSGKDKDSVELHQVNAFERLAGMSGKVGGEAPPQPGQESAWEKLNILVTSVGFFKWVAPNAELGSKRRVDVGFTDQNNRRYYVSALPNIKTFALRFFQHQIRRGYHAVFPVRWAINEGVSYQDMIDGSLLPPPE